MSSGDFIQIEKYKKYIRGIVLPTEREHLIAVDNAIFSYLLENTELLSEHSEDEISKVTTRFGLMCDMESGQTTREDIFILDKRIINNACCEEGK